MHRSADIVVYGDVRSGFEPVRSAFVENFSRRKELGGACCVYLNGERVVDLWGGVREAASGAPWEEDTMVLVYSLTKGMSAMTLALAHSRGWIDYEERVARYWPEFARNGKEEVTVRQLLSHQAGLHAFHQKIDRAVIADPVRLAGIMQDEKPQWPPGTRNAYHFISLGFYEGELLRRIDPKHRSLGVFFREEIGEPLGIDFHIGLSADVPNERLATLEQAGFLESIAGLPLPVMLAALNPWSATFRACIVNPGSGVTLDKARIYPRDLEIPAGGGVGTARAVARAYGAFATGGAELGISPATLAALRAPAAAPERGFYDEVLKCEAQYGLGFMKSFGDFAFGRKDAFGFPGAGGSLGYADPGIGLGYGYVTNRIASGFEPDPRDVALREAIASVVR